MSGSGVLVRSSNERGDEGAKQGFAATTRVVHELEEAEVGTAHPDTAASDTLQLASRVLCPPFVGAKAHNAHRAK